MSKITMRKSPDGTMYPDRGAFKKWPLASEEEISDHMAIIKARAEAAESMEGEKAEDSGEVKALKAKIKELETRKEKPELGPTAQGNDDDGDEKDPDACKSLEEAIAMVRTLTANECDAYAERLDMPVFGSRVRVGDKQDAIIARMEELAAGEGSGEENDGEGQE